MSFDTLTSTLSLSLSLPFSWGAKRKRKDSQEGIEEVFVQCENEMPERWRGGWYVVVATSLLATNQPHHLRDLYIHLARPLIPLSSPPPPTDIAELNHLTLRLRDTCQKAWILTGIAPVLAGVSALAEGEKDVGLLYNQHGMEEEGVGRLSERWKNAQLTEESLARGQRFVQSLYAHDLAPTFANAWGSHLPDLRWQQESVIYGLFLSDHTVLSATETEFVTLSALLCGRVDPPKRWHLRGLRRLGVKREEVQAVVGVVKRVALWGGVSEAEVGGWPEMEEVEGEV